MNTQPVSSSEKIRNILLSAGIYRKHRRMILRDLGKIGKEALDYYKGDNYVHDYDNGIGLFVCGGLSDNNSLLPVFAKTEALAGKGVYFLYLNNLIEALEGTENNRTLERVHSVRNLYIAWFQTEGECPYTHREIMNASQILLTREEKGLRTGFSACKHLHLCDWWPNELRGVFQDKIRTLTIGGFSSAKKDKQ